MGWDGVWGWLWSGVWGGYAPADTEGPTIVRLSRGFTARVVENRRGCRLVSP